MIRNIISLCCLFFIFSCSGFEFVLTENSERNSLRGKTFLVVSGEGADLFAQELLLFFEDNKEGDFILKTSFNEKKENRLVRKNQVAEKIDYEIKTTYNLFDKEQDCRIFFREITSKFSFVPKSFGYNFGTDRSLEKLYKNSIRSNIQSFIDAVPDNKNCIK